MDKGTLHTCFSNFNTSEFCKSKITPFLLQLANLWINLKIDIYEKLLPKNG